MLINLFKRTFARQVKKNNFLQSMGGDIFNDNFEIETKENLQIQTSNQTLPDQISQDKIINEIQQDNQVQNDQIQTKEQMEFLRQTLLYQGEDQFPEKIVHRPEKQVVWGLGGELLRVKQQVFNKNQNPTVEQVREFLELEQCKDIKIIDMKELGRFDCPHHSIIATTYSEKHNYRVGSNLVRAVRDLKIKNQKIKPSLHGRTDDEWILACIQEIDVHLFLEDAREEMNLEYRWLNPISDEESMEREKEILDVLKGKHKPLEL